MPRDFVRRVLFERFFLTLGCLLGVMQVVIGHWITVVVAGREGPGLPLGVGLAALLVVANGTSVPILRRATRNGGLVRRLARGYIALGLATILLGAAVSLSWLGFFSLGCLLGLLGVSPATLFEAFRIGSVLIVASLLGMIVWGFTGGQARIEYTRLRVPLRDAPEGLRIVQASDFHIGNRMEGRRLGRLVEQMNRQEADLIALTGDLFDFDPAYLEEGARALGKLQARLGVYAVLGNHDTYTGAERVAEALTALAPSVTLLRGDVVRLSLETPFYVAGIDDPGRDWTAGGLELPALSRLRERCPEDGPVLLLVHRPEAFPQAARLGFPLVLAGHTHGGQLALPTPGGALNLARLITRFDRGIFELEGSLLYVNRGVGVAGPALRFNCPREIATIELVGDLG